MKRFFVLTLLALLPFVKGVSAQTPQQLEMLKSRGGDAAGIVGYSDENPVYIDEKTGRAVIPTNPNPKKAKINGVDAILPMAKTDAEIRATISGPDITILSKMNDEDKKKYWEYLVQDRIFLSTSNLKVTSTPTGMKYCQVQVNVANNTPRHLNKIYVTYSWGDIGTSVTFSNIGPAGGSTKSVALAGSVCNLMADGAKYTVGACSMDGLTEDQCRLRIAKQ